MAIRTASTTAVFVGCSSGQVEFHPVEHAYYTLLFAALDVDDDSQVTGSDGSLFLRRSKLANDNLRDIWRQSCGGVSESNLSVDQFVIACKLAALCQSKQECSLTLLTEKRYRKMEFADFSLCEIFLPDDSQGTTGEILVEVSDAKLIGEGMRQYATYCNKFKTNLTSFSSHEHESRRRFSDYEWLAKCLQKFFPGHITPPLPDKSISRNSEAVVQARTRELSLFLRNIACHPQLKHSFLFRMFLEATEEGFAAVKEAYSNSAYTSAVIGSALAGVEEEEGAAASDGSSDPISSPNSTTSEAGSGAGGSSSIKAMALMSRWWGSAKLAVNSVSAAISGGAAPPVELPQDTQYEEILAKESVVTERLTELANRFEVLINAERNRAMNFKQVAACLSHMCDQGKNSHMDLEIMSTAATLDPTVDVSLDSIEKIRNDIVAPIRFLGKCQQSIAAASRRRVKLGQKAESDNNSLHRSKVNLESVKQQTGPSQSEALASAEERVRAAEGALDASKLQYAQVTRSIKADLGWFNSNKTFDIKHRLLDLVQLSVSNSRKNRLVWDQARRDMKEQVSRMKSLSASNIHLSSHAESSDSHVQSNAKAVDKGNLPSPPPLMSAQVFTQAATAPNIEVTGSVGAKDQDFSDNESA